MKKRISIILSLLLATSLFGACSSEPTEPTTEPAAQEAEATEGTEVEPAPAEATAEGTPDPTKLIEESMAPMTMAYDGKTASAVWTDIKELTPEEIAAAKEKKFKAGIENFTAVGDWANAWSQGNHEIFELCGVEVMSEPDAAYKPDVQTKDVESMIVMGVDIITAVPIDQAANSLCFQEACKAGITVSLTNTGPDNLVAGEDYASIVFSDDTGHGVRSAHLLAEAIGAKGKIGMIYLTSVSPPNVRRYEGACDTFAKYYPDIEIVAQQGFDGADSVGQAEKIAADMLIQHPDLDGIWTLYDAVCEGAMAACKAAGKTDIVLTTVDNGLNVSTECAEGGLVYGIAAQIPYNMGRVCAINAVRAALGTEVPPTVAATGLVVRQDNCSEVWKQVYNSENADLLAAQAAGDAKK